MLGWINRVLYLLFSARECPACRQPLAPVAGAEGSAETLTCVNLHCAFHERRFLATESGLVYLR